MFREKLPSCLLRDILDRVALELEQRRAQVSLGDLQAKSRSTQPPRDFHGVLSADFGLIAEIKRKSPSLGEMLHHDVDRIARVYAESPVVRAVSVLTNQTDFGMNVEDLERVRGIVAQPILRKDFIFDPYQVWQARAHGADAILLMANVLTKEGLAELSQLAESLGMAVLFESHERAELPKLPPGAKICGINSRRFMAGKGKSTRLDYWLSGTLRRLFGLRVDLSIDRSHFDMVDSLPAGCLKIAESGVEPSMIGILRDQLGFHAALVGTSILMDKRGVQHALQKFETEIASRQLNLPLRPDRQPLHGATA